MRLRPITLRAANEFIREHHRHNDAVRGWKFGVALVEGEEIVGVGVASRPVARGLDDGETLEIIRTVTVGHKNACTMLYGALCRAAEALGYTSVVTYTLQSEPGSSLKAAGFEVEAFLSARTDMGWKRRPQSGGGTAEVPIDPKIRWRRRLRQKDLVAA